MTVLNGRQANYLTGTEFTAVDTSEKLIQD